MKVLRLTLSAVALAAAGGFAGQACAASTAPSAFTTPPAGGTTPTHAWHGGHRGGIGRALLAELNLTADQQALVKSIYAQAKPQLQALATSSRTTRDALLATSPTDAGYGELLATAEANAQKRVALRAQIWGQIYSTVLTSSQQAQIPALIAAIEAARAAHKPVPPVPPVPTQG